MSEAKAVMVVAWHNPDQLAKFKKAWAVNSYANPPIHFQQDTNKEGCARTKNKGVDAALEAGADVIVVVDDDCFPARNEFGDPYTLHTFIEAHVKALEPADVPMFRPVTSPPSRGTPYFTRKIKMPVAASMGFWEHVGDYGAADQLAHGATHKMVFDRTPVFGQYFALSGMNMAFTREWASYMRFIDVPRFDDIWLGFIAQRIAYDKGYCFNLGGPLVTHSRQSHVFTSLKQEAQWLEENESLWAKIATAEYSSYDDLRKLLPV